MVVVGSVNRDLVVVVERHPTPGETILGSRHLYGPGGKGANQAVAAARLGASVAFVGVVGPDGDGEAMIDNLEFEGVDVSGVVVSEQAATGLAVITVAGDGENSIVVSPGANQHLDADVVGANSEAIASATVVVAQLEVPIESVMLAARLASGTFILNPAPARSLPPGLLDAVDVLVPNRNELGVLASVDEPGTLDEVRVAVERLESKAEVVVTLGADGAYVAGDQAQVGAPIVEPIDTTGAGDAFCGALAVELSRGVGMKDAVRFAAAAGALATTSLGARAAPTRQDVEALLDG